MENSEKLIPEEELDNVSGGCGDNTEVPGDRSKYNNYTIPVDKYSGVIGNRYLFDNGDGQWIFGELLNSYESFQLLYTYRVQDVRVIDAHGFSNSSGPNSIELSEYGTIEIYGDEYQMYAKAGE